MYCRQPHTALIAVALAAGLAVGCAEETPAPSPIAAKPAAAPAPAPAAEKIETAPTPSQSAAGEPTGKTNTPDLAEPSQATEDAAPQIAAAEEYKPPFPDRVDVFVAPKRQGVTTGQNDTEFAVELLGFVRVDRPRVVLSINGQITPIAEGDTELGVEVISIQAPTVVLQRGRQRWQATLEN